MPPRSEEELDPVTLHNQVRWDMSSIFISFVIYHHHLHLVGVGIFGRKSNIHLPETKLSFIKSTLPPLKPSQMYCSFIVNMETMILVRDGGGKWDGGWWFIDIISQLTTIISHFWSSSLIAADLLAENAHLTFSFLSQVHLTNLPSHLINYLSHHLPSHLDSRSNMNFWKRSH